MKRGGVSVVVALSLVCLLGQSVTAGTLNRGIISVSGGIVQLGGDADKMLSDYLDTIYTYNLSVQVPLGDYVALLGNVGRTTTSTSLSEEDIAAAEIDIVGLSFGGGVRLQYVSDMPIAPFITAIYGRSKTDITGTAADLDMRGKLENTQTTLTLAIGAEWSITDRFSIMGTFARIKDLSDSQTLTMNGETIDLDDEIDGEIDAADTFGLRDKEDVDVVSLIANFFLSDKILLSGLVAHELDEKTMTYQIGLGFAF